MFEDWIPEEYTELMRGDFSLGVFFRLETSPVLRVWAGASDIPAGFDSMDADGTVYLGGGKLAGIPVLEVLMMGTSDRVEFVLSGVDVATGNSVFSSFPEVRGVNVYVGIAPLDQYHQPVGSIVSLWTGSASHIARVIPVKTGRGPRTMSLVLVATGGSNTRSRPSRSLWSPAHHKSVYPTDLGCDNTPRYGRGTQSVWPRW